MVKPNSTSSNQKEAEVARDKVLDLSSALLTLTSQQTSVSSGLQGLWKEHLEIRKHIEDITMAQKEIPSKTGDIFHDIDPQDAKLEIPNRDSALDAFLEWSRKRAGIQTDGVKVTALDPTKYGGGYGLQATENLKAAELDLPDVKPAADNKSDSKQENAANLKNGPDSDIPAPRQLVFVPRKAIMSYDSAKKSKVLREAVEKDPILRGMHNVALAVFLLCEKIKGADSFWAPYIAFLPNRHSTPLSFSVQELELLRGSHAFEESLKMYRNVSRQFSYFLHLMGAKGNNPLGKTQLTLRNFTFNVYRWAVSTVTTRMNLIGSEGEAGLKIPALIPYLDLANHRKGRLTTHYDDETKGVVVYAQTDFKPGDQVYIYYGARSQGEYLLHDGFVADSGFEQNSLTLKLGLSRNDKYFAARTILLSAFGLKPNDDFRITMMREGLATPPVLKAATEERMMHFVRIFVSEPATLEAAKEHQTDVQELHAILCHDCEIEKKVWEFLKVRFQLLLKGYKADNYNAQSVKIEEKKNSADSKSTEGKSTDSKSTDGTADNKTPPSNQLVAESQFSQQNDVSPMHLHLIRALVESEKKILSAAIKLADEKIKEMQI